MYNKYSKGSDSMVKEVSVKFKDNVPLNHKITL